LNHEYLSAAAEPSVELAEPGVFKDKTSNALPLQSLWKLLGRFGRMEKNFEYLVG
jgi:hypothetical protein